MSERVRRGDFLVPKDDLERVEETFSERSERSQATDRSTRAPITTDVEVYEAMNGRGVDYPGVDTPTDEPSEAVGDFNFPGEMDEAYGRGGFEVNAGEPSTATEEAGAQGRSIIDAILGDSR